MIGFICMAFIIGLNINDYILLESFHSSLDFILSLKCNQVTRCFYVLK